jgi:hypothetical protein
MLHPNASTIPQTTEDANNDAILQQQSNVEMATPPPNGYTKPQWRHNSMP